MSTDFIYLDYNATTPVDPRVAEAMTPYLHGFFGNPSSSHRYGREARAAVERAREQVASCLGAESREIFFTSGGTESNNLAIRGVIERRGGGHVVTSAVEHPAVTEVLRPLQASGQIELTVVGVDANGVVSPRDVAAALRPDTVLVSIMLANNEVGAVEPLREISEVCQTQEQVLLHTDASQAVGKIPVRVRELAVDLLTVAGHKLYAPKGIGALYVRRGIELEPLLRGAGHERGLRPGTENVLEQVGLGEACALVEQDVADEESRLAALRDELERLLIEGAAPRTPVVHAKGAKRLPNTLSISFPGIDANELLSDLSEEVAASAGAACHAETVKPSGVLTAMGVERETALSTIRLSVGRFTTNEEVRAGARRILEVMAATDLPLPSPG